MSSLTKEKASKVVVHRIEFQQKERELLEGVMQAYSFNRLANPIVALMSDVSGMIAFASILALVGITVDVGGLNSDSSMNQVTDRIKEAVDNRQNLRANMSAQERDRLRAGGDPSFIGGVEEIIRMTLRQIFNPPEPEFNP